MAAPKDFSKLFDTKFDTKKIYRQRYAEGATLPVVGYCLDLGDVEAVARAEKMIDGILSLGFSLIVFVSRAHGNSKKYSFLARDGVRVVSPASAGCEELWQVCDVVYCFGVADVYRAFGAGVVPLVCSDVRSGVENYDPVSERGSAFVYDELSVWHMISALVRAAETYKLPFDWKCVVRNGG